MKKKKIAFYCDSMNIGGTEKATLDLANNLSEEKYDITIIQFSPGGKYHNQLKKHIKTKTIAPIGPEKSFRIFWWTKRILAHIPIRWAHKFLIGDNYDIEVACGYGYPTRIVSASKNAYKISWIHMDVSLDRNYVTEMTYDEGQKYFKNIDKFVCVSRDCAKKFNEKFGFKEKTTVCYNILDSKEIGEKSQEQLYKFYDREYTNIVSVGRLTWQKGFDMLISAVAKLIKFDNRIRLYILGEGEDKQELANQIETLNVQNNVKLLGYIDNPYKYMKNADIYVCSSRHESFSLTVAESIIIGTPIVSTKCTGPIELLENGKYGVLVENNAKGIYEGILSIIQDSDKYEHYKKMLKERKNFFELRESVKNWENVLD
jgi:glycosyltransferase involved in cell wall biosynthesis